MLRLSNKKQSCENYLFEDYRWKSGITIWILTLKSSGSNVALLPPWLPKKWAGRPHDGLPGEPGKSEDFSRKVIGSFSVPSAMAALSRRGFLMTSIRNQQKLLEK
jgi:hypothetical protein